MLDYIFTGFTQLNSRSNTSGNVPQLYHRAINVKAKNWSITLCHYKVMEHFALISLDTQQTPCLFHGEHTFICSCVSSSIWESCIWLHISSLKLEVIMNRHEINKGISSAVPRFKPTLHHSRGWYCHDKLRYKPVVWARQRWSEIPWGVNTAMWGAYEMLTTGTKRNDHRCMNFKLLLTMGGARIGLCNI